MHFVYKGFALENTLSYKILKVTADLKSAHELYKEGVMNDQARNEWARAVGNAIYDAKHVHSGLVSGKALQHRYTTVVINGKKATDSAWTPEHFIPRQIAGHWMLDWALSLDVFDMTRLSEVHEKIQQYRFAHYVLPQENNDLRPHQKKGTFTTPEESYKKAGIDLYEWKMGTKIHFLPEIYPHLTQGIALY